jgi:protein-disulfide isomerase
VIAFPKTAQAQCVLTGAPALVADTQLQELHVAVVQDAQQQQLDEQQQGQQQQQQQKEDTLMQ